MAYYERRGLGAWLIARPPGVVSPAATTYTSKTAPAFTGMQSLLSSRIAAARPTVFQPSIIQQITAARSLPIFSPRTIPGIRVAPLPVAPTATSVAQQQAIPVVSVPTQATQLSMQAASPAPMISPLPGGSALMPAGPEPSGEETIATPPGTMPGFKLSAPLLVIGGLALLLLTRRGGRRRAA